jgi:predicted dehydrogenase
MTQPDRSGPRVVIVGAGHGCRVHLPALRAAGFHVVGLVGTDQTRTGRAAERHGIAHAFTDLDAAIAQTGSTAVTVASPPHTHAGVVLAALGRGCHVLCEKPFARDAAEARMLLAEAGKAGIVHAVGNQMRMNPERILVARAIAEGLIGEPRFITIAQYAGLVADPGARRPGWWFDAEAGGGWLGASGSHMIDMVRSWLGEFVSLSASLPIVSERERVAEDSFAIRFAMANGVEGIMQQTGGAWGPYASLFRVAGTRGTVWLDEGTAWIADRSGARPLPVPPELELVPMAPSDDPRKPYIHIELPPSIRLCEAWRVAIEGRAAGVPFATFADGLACMEVIDAARASASAGGALVAVRGAPG